MEECSDFRPKHKLILHRNWYFLDASNTESLKLVSVPAGEYVLVEIQSPFGDDGVSWLVFDGTLIGAAKEYWSHWPTRCTRTGKIELW